jgi:hypothetical protein
MLEKTVLFKKSITVYYRKESIAYFSGGYHEKDGD